MHTNKDLNEELESRYTAKEIEGMAKYVERFNKEKDEEKLSNLVMLRKIDNSNYTKRMMSKMIVYIINIITMILCAVISIPLFNKLAVLSLINLGAFWFVPVVQVLFIITSLVLINYLMNKVYKMDITKPEDKIAKILSNQWRSSKQTRSS